MSNVKLSNTVFSSDTVSGTVLRLNDSMQNWTIDSEITDCFLSARIPVNVKNMISNGIMAEGRLPTPGKVYGLQCMELNMKDTDAVATFKLVEIENLDKK